MPRKTWIVVAVLLLVASTTSVNGMNAAIQFEAIDYACEGGNILTSMEPLIDGTSVVEVPSMNKKKFTVDATFFPAAFLGSTWEVPGHGQLLPDGSFVVHHQGVGTGDLAGGRIKFKVTPVDVDLPPGCNLVGPVVLLDGVIIFPPGHNR